MEESPGPLPDARMAAAEMKKQRTRGKLISAVGNVMDFTELGWDASVENIVEAAEVSMTTFYNFYKSRNQLCMDAFGELVLAPLEVVKDKAPETTFETAANILIVSGIQFNTVLRGALIGRLESGIWQSSKPRLRFIEERWGSYPITDRTFKRYLQLEDGYDFVDRTAKLLADDTIINRTYRTNHNEAIVPALLSSALFLLDNITRKGIVNTEWLTAVTYDAVEKGPKGTPLIK
jgi:AcrR family transcriptional regulator